jgi:hypothetical protein
MMKRNIDEYDFQSQTLYLMKTLRAEIAEDSLKVKCAWRAVVEGECEKI